MWKVWNKTVKCKIHFHKWRLNHCFRHPGIFRNGNEKNVTRTTKMTTRYISFAPLKFLLRCFLKKKALKHTTTSVQDPLQIKCSLQFDKWQIKRAEIIETTIKNTNFEEKGHFRNLFFFNALCFPFFLKATGTRQPSAVFTLEAIIRLWVYACVLHTSLISRIYFVTVLCSPIPKKTCLLITFFGNKEQCR